ncbi:MAG: phosphodiesterase [Gammaproteobacteria bacterium]
MRTRSRRLLAATLAMAGIAGMAHADTLIMQGIEQARATAAERPLRGMTMKAVATRWGEPAEKQAPVGQPPITRWDYGDFVVFFEYDHVIDAVPRRR